MNTPIITIQSKAAGFPEIFHNIPDPPQQIYVISNNWPDLLKTKCLAVVGSRKITAYGKAVTTTLAGDLARAGVCIVSGLAIGIDAAAHRAALGALGVTIAVLAGGLDAIYPSSHQQLAGQIVAQGGALVSEYPPGVPTYKQNFIARNRLVSGLSEAILITEATEKSGTWHTARFALEQGKDVLAVPGNITSPASIGTNRLIRSGATAITSSADIFQALGIKPPSAAPKSRGDTPEEQQILDILADGPTDGARLLQLSGLEITLFNQSLTMLEITGKIRGLGNNQWIAD